MFTLLQNKNDKTGRISRHIDPQIFDLLQLSKAERECRENFLTLKQKLHDIRQPERHYANLGEMILRRRVENAALYYRFVRRERIRLFRDYVGRLPVHDSVAA